MRTLHPRLRRFHEERDGSISVEAVIIFPLLLWTFVAMFVFWDAFKTQNISLKATYTIADLISREANPITKPYIEGANDVFGFLIDSGLGNDIRVSVVKMQLGADGVTPEHSLEWSEATGAMIEHTDITFLAPKLPIMSVGDEIIVVESETLWKPLITKIPVMGTVLEERTLKELVFTSPRFTPQVEFDDSVPSG